ncbi:MAG: hypothetical protein ABWZ25_03145 [Chitinophagaceae bacterium]
MQIDKELIPALSEIDFINRYKKLSMDHRFGDDEAFEQYSNDIILEIVSSFGFKPKYYKRENFFGIQEYNGDYTFEFNLSFKYGYVECIWGIQKKGERLTIGGPWGMIAQLLTQNYDESIKRPMFRNYEELKDILSYSFELFKDFKNEIIKNSIEDNSI